MRKNNLRNYIKKRGLKTVWLYGQLGVSKQTMYHIYKYEFEHIEKGFIDKLLEILGADINEVFPIIRED